MWRAVAHCHRGAAMLRFSRCSVAANSSLLNTWPEALYAGSSVRLSSFSTDRQKERQQRLMQLWYGYAYPESPAESQPGDVFMGFLGRRRTIGKHLSFADINLPSGEVVQICSSAEREAAHRQFLQIPAHTPVCVHAEIESSSTEKGSDVRKSQSAKRKLALRAIRPLNSVPADLIVTPEVHFPPTKRHLQIRFHPELQARLRFRSWLKSQFNWLLLRKGFIEVETPTLFKSTSEGAREFLVPLRNWGSAYALSQSPQQYKQVLMASGIPRYMQWARCYRDEDVRKDRQPEFSQLDLEWAFAGDEDVRNEMNELVLDVLSALCPTLSYQDVRGHRIPKVEDIPTGPTARGLKDAHQFTTISFADSIAAYGTDKPDLRIPNRIHAIPDLEPIRKFVSKMTEAPDPVLEVFTFPLKSCSPQVIRTFVEKYVANASSTHGEMLEGVPQILVSDSSRPLNGFSPLGSEYHSILDLASGGKGVKNGDIVVFQARKRSTEPDNSDSTLLGRLRASLWKALVEKGYMEMPPRLGEPGSLQFVWVTDFPMFKLVEHKTNVGEEPMAPSISATHHPFTAPKSTEDMESLFTSPLKAKSAAYDLVLNGVEIGGGSRRNHVAEIQEFILSDVLKMPEIDQAQFFHLFAALRAGCPPHAGFALGFDRLTALLTDTSTVRDVIAFPKSMDGEDLFARSPGKLTISQLKALGLKRFHVP